MGLSKGNRRAFGISFKLHNDAMKKLKAVLEELPREVSRKAVEKSLKGPVDIWREAMLASAPKGEGSKSGRNRAPTKPGAVGRPRKRTAKNRSPFSTRWGRLKTRRNIQNQTFKVLRGKKRNNAQVKRGRIARTRRGPKGGAPQGNFHDFGSLRYARGTRRIVGKQWPSRWARNAVLPRAARVAMRFQQEMRTNVPIVVKNLKVRAKSKKQVT